MAETKSINDQNGISPQKRPYPKDNSQYWDFIGEDIFDSLTDGEYRFIDTIIRDHVATFNMKFESLTNFRNSKINLKIATIQLEAAKRAQDAALKTETHSRRIFFLTLVIALAAGIQAFIALIALSLNY